MIVDILCNLSVADRLYEATNGKFQLALRTDSFNSMFGFGIMLRSQTLDSLSYKDKPRNSNLIDFPFSGFLSGGEKSTISGFLPFVSFRLRICTLPSSFLWCFKIHSLIVAI